MDLHETLRTQTSALLDHAKAGGHLNAVSVLQSHSKASLQSFSEKASAAGNECLKAQLRTVLCMTKRNIAPNNFLALIDLQKNNGCPSLCANSQGDNNIYKHNESIKQMEASLVSVVKEKLKQKIRE